MDYAEAIEWLQGKRDMVNSVQYDPQETFHERLARANAAKCEQAYWVCRANRENVV